MALVLIRHTAVADAEGLCYGALDLALADSAPQDIAAVLAQVESLDAVITSPATRCRQLAAALAVRDACPLTVEPALRELDFGLWEGCRWDDIDRAQSDPWAEDPWNRAPPGGECEASMWHRLQGWLEASPLVAGARVAVVAHGGPLRLLRCHLEGRDLRERWSLTVPLGGVIDYGA